MGSCHAAVKPSVEHHLFARRITAQIRIESSIADNDLAVGKGVRQSVFFPMSRDLADDEREEKEERAERAERAVKPRP